MRGSHASRPLRRDWQARRICFQAKARYFNAEALFRRALGIAEKSHGPDHRTTGTCLNNLAELLRITNRPRDAEPLFRRALAIAESYDPDHPAVAVYLNNFSLLLQYANPPREAESFFRRGLGIAEKNWGPEHPFAIPHWIHP
jgi:tetratricopeptide (TPR) repeat protein